MTATQPVPGDSPEEREELAEHFMDALDEAEQQPAEPAPTVPDLDAIRARVENADDGPWQYQRLPWGRTVIAGGYDFTLDIADHLRSERDAEFIAHAREDVPALLAEVERLRAQRDAAVAQAEECRNYIIESGAAKLRRALAGDPTP